MSNSNVIDRINTKENVNSGNGSASTSFDDAYMFDTSSGTYVQQKTQSKVWQSINNFVYEPNNEVKSLVKTKERGILNAQTMFKKSIRLSLKAFLITLTITFLNIFI